MADSSTERPSPVIVALLAAALAFALALLQWGQVLNWDELEFARATRWIAEGRVPFRDFWEHHLPLQWLLFAPIAAMFDGPGAASVVALRWAQIPLWIGTCALLGSLMRRAEINTRGRWTAALLLLSSLWFGRAALQYRVDVPGHLAYIAALWLIVHRRASWLAGALLSLAVLANMRLAPLVVITVLLALFWRPDAERWAWNGRVLRVIAAGIAVALAVIVALHVSGAYRGFMHGVVWYNRSTDRMLPDEASVFFARLITPFVQHDLGGAAFLVAAAAGVFLALRRIARPGTVQFLALIALASLSTIAALGIQYEYHFQTSALLLIPAAAYAIDRLRNEKYVLALAGIAAAGLALNAIALAPGFGKSLAYQDRVMTEVDRITQPNDRVWDSVGYALRREPAYPYWFLPAGVRFLADRNLIAAYDLEQLAAHPPAAIVFTGRTRFWLEGRPRLARHVFHHYLPLYQHLWIPGLSGMLGPQPSRATWTVPRSGYYDLYVSELLPKHPWFSRPSQYILLAGTELAIPLDELPVTPAPSYRWSVNGNAIETRTVELRAGDRLQLVTLESRKVGVLAVPHGVRTLSMMPDGTGPF
jgi:hypothetical protein